MRFLVSEIRNAGQVERSEALDPNTVLGQAPEYVTFGHPLNVDVKATMSSTDIVVSGHASAVIGFVCARCMESFERTISGEFQQVFGLDLKEFDVTDDIKEAIYIDLPLTPVCKESCKGLCPACGKNRNQVNCSCKTQDNGHSAWNILKEFRSQTKRS